MIKWKTEVKGLKDKSNEAIGILPPRHAPWFHYGPSPHSLIHHQESTTKEAWNPWYGWVNSTFQGFRTLRLTHHHCYGEAARCFLNSMSFTAERAEAKTDTHTHPGDHQDDEGKMENRRDSVEILLGQNRSTYIKKGDGASEKMRCNHLQNNSRKYSIIERYELLDKKNPLALQHSRRK